MQFDGERLLTALAGTPDAAWSLPSEYAVTGVHHGYRRITLVDAGNPWREAGPFRFVLERLAPIHDAWLSWIGPGGFIAPHRDAGPWRERWQVPIVTAGEFHGSESSAAVCGRAFTVEHWKPHAVTNPTDHPRIHLVIDRAVWLNRKAEPFALFPIPDYMAELVRRSLRATNT